ncbi:MAG: YbaK/EbsC family protein [Oceanicoccus sp.]
MAISVTLKRYLEQHQVEYQTVHHHHHTDTAFNSAKTAHIPASSMVKGVLLHDDNGFMIASTTATRTLNLNAINDVTKRSFKLANEDDLNRLLHDCEKGSVPALGQAFGLATIWDDNLALQPGFYLETGDHKELIRLSHLDFMSLIKDDLHGAISN